MLLPELSQSVGALSQPTESAAQASCIDITHCRTIWNIIWSCLATIAACAWVAVHRNVPDPRSGMVRVNLDRVLITICALLVPEYIIGWAVRQWLTARRIARTNEKLAKKARDRYRRRDVVTSDGDSGIVVSSDERIEFMLREAVQAEDEAIARKETAEKAGGWRLKWYQLRTKFCLDNDHR